MKKIILIFTVFLVGLLSACNTWIDPDLNTDPNSPTNASYYVVLPTIQAGMGYVLGGDLGRTASLFTQHNLGVERQQLGIYNYVLKEDDIDNAWRFNLYGGPMQDLDDIIKDTYITNSPHYRGICQVMQAHALGTVTDLWNDVPCSDAWGGAGNPKPAYDTQEEVYAKIQSMLSDAIANMDSAISVFKPGADDLIYGGDLSKWRKAAHSLKARFALHLVKRNPAAAADALMHAASGFMANGDDMQFTFGTLETEANPWYQFSSQREGDLYFGEKLSGLMNTLNDPRRPFYASPDDSGTYTTDSYMGPFYASPNSPVPFITYTELQFIKAEAMFRMANPTGAHAEYLLAVTASLVRTGVAAADVAAYLAQAAVDPGSANLTLNDIMTQKYIAMYTQCESFVDWRRTGFPALTPVTGNDVPRRFPYAQSERLYNAPNYKAGVTIFDRVWWDVP